MESIRGKVQIRQNWFDGQIQIGELKIWSQERTMVSTIDGNYRLVTVMNWRGQKRQRQTEEKGERDKGDKCNWVRQTEMGNVRPRRAN